MTLLEYAEDKKTEVDKFVFWYENFHSTAPELYPIDLDEKEWLSKFKEFKRIYKHRVVLTL